jgi:hypothetical protein
MSATHQALSSLEYIFICIFVLCQRFCKPGNYFCLPVCGALVIPRPQQLNRTQHVKYSRKKCASFVLFVGRGFYTVCTHKRGQTPLQGAFFFSSRRLTLQFFFGEFCVATRCARTFLPLLRGHYTFAA